MTVLQLVRLDVLPQAVDDDGARLRVHAEQTSEARVELELAWLVVEHEQHRALDVLVACALHLETVSLLRRRRAVPLKTRHGVTECNTSAASELTSTRWLSGPYRSLSSSMTRLLKKDENLRFDLFASLDVDDVDVDAPALFVFKRTPQIFVEIL